MVLAFCKCTVTKIRLATCPASWLGLAACLPVATRATAWLVSSCSPFSKVDHGIFLCFKEGDAN